MTLEGCDPSDGVLSHMITSRIPMLQAFIAPFSQHTLLHDIAFIEKLRRDGHDFYMSTSTLAYKMTLNEQHFELRKGHCHKQGRHILRRHIDNDVKLGAPTQPRCGGMIAQRRVGGCLIARALAWSVGSKLLKAVSCVHADRTSM